MSNTNSTPTLTLNIKAEEKKAELAAIIATVWPEEIKPMIIALGAAISGKNNGKARKAAEQFLGLNAPLADHLKMVTCTQNPEARPLALAQIVDLTSKALKQAYPECKDNHLQIAKSLGSYLTTMYNEGLAKLQAMEPVMGEKKPELNLNENQNPVGEVAQAIVNHITEKEIEMKTERIRSGAMIEIPNQPETKKENTMENKTEKKYVPEVTEFQVFKALEKEIPADEAKKIPAKKVLTYPEDKAGFFDLSQDKMLRPAFQALHDRDTLGFRWTHGVAVKLADWNSVANQVREDMEKAKKNAEAKDASKEAKEKAPSAVDQAVNLASRVVSKTLLVTAKVGLWTLARGTQLLGWGYGKAKSLVVGTGNFVKGVWNALFEKKAEKTETAPAASPAAVTV